MIKTGTLRTGHEIGRSYNHKFIWLACIDCGKERWVMYHGGKPQSAVCRLCSLKRCKPWQNRQPKPKTLCLDCGKLIRRSKSGYCKECRYSHPEYSPGWKGGKTRDRQGHILIRVNHGYIREHLLIWEKAHGKLPFGFVIHHLNGIPDDNRLENLAALPTKKHNAILKAYKNRIRELENTIKGLKGQFNLL